MTALEDVPKVLAESLDDAGFRVFDHVPESLSPPCIVIAPADPYLEQGETFDGSNWAVNLAVYLIVRGGTNQRQYELLNRMLGEVLPHFQGDGTKFEPWTVEVGQPIAYSINGHEYFGVRIAASNHFDLG